MTESLEQTAAIGNQAKQLLQSQMWTQAVERINLNLLEKMGQHHSDPIACQEIALTKKVTDNFVAYFEGIAEDGRVANYELMKKDE